jgi:outer membrane protein OmpA-like peptidoglycan-associated protein
MLTRINYLFIGAIWFLSTVLLQAQDKQSNLIVHTAVFYFNSGRSNLLPKHQKKLATIVEVLRADAAVKVSIAAHTDSIGAAAFNESLAGARAKSILEALLARNIETDKLDINSYGEYAPSATNATAEGRAKNRRVTVNILKPFVPKQTVPTMVPDFLVKGQIRDKYSKDILSNTMVVVEGNGIQDTAYTDDEGRYQIAFPQAAEVRIQATAPKFFFQTKKTSLIARRASIVDFELDPAIVGNKIQLGGLYFQGGTPVLLSSSEQTLLAVLEFLKINKDLRIELGGHINKPNQAPVLENSTSFTLSEARARAVFNYLTSQGIAEDRIVYKGYGNWQMLYPKTTDPNEQQANRRVELKIIE